MESRRICRHLEGLKAIVLFKVFESGIGGDFPSFQAFLPQSSRYDAYGENIGGTGDVSNKYLFSGEQYDSNLDDYYLRTRYYVTDAGRFIRRDTYEGTLTDPVSLHKYVYTHNDPVNLIDPSGLTPLSDAISIFRKVGLLSALDPVYAFAQAGGYVHRAIEADIVEENSGVLVEQVVNGGRIDVLELPNAIYDIKPLDGVVNPHIQLNRYIRMNPDRGVYKGTHVFEGRVNDIPLLPGISLSYYTDEPGVITYYPFLNQLGLSMVAATIIAIKLAAEQESIGRAVAEFVSTLVLTRGRAISF